MQITKSSPRFIVPSSRVFLKGGQFCKDGLGAGDCCKKARGFKFCIPFDLPITLLHTSFLGLHKPLLV